MHLPCSQFSLAANIAHNFRFFFLTLRADRLQPGHALGTYEPHCEDVTARAGALASKCLKHSFTR